MRRPAVLPFLVALTVVSGCSRPHATSAPPPPASTLAGPTGGAMHLPTTVAGWAIGAQLFEGLGQRHRPVTTASTEARRYFDQGMALMWGFNHDEATRSFAKAAALDPQCAACFWGVSLTVGPNYNLPLLSTERARVAHEALELATAGAGRAAPVEQALIRALAKRYPDAKPLGPDAALPVLAAYAAAMKQVAQQFPADLDVRTLYAESLMNLRAWKLWAADGTPAPGTIEIVETLESVLASDPSHPGANHYLVHALEASPHPERALASAERLRELVPGAGHLVHMPAHIFQRVGRYEDAAEANRRAAVADEAYAARTTPPDYYPVMYTAHNYQFLAYSAAMEGRRFEALEAADRSRATVTDAMLLEMPGADWYVAEIYTARVRFGLWDELLAMPVPDSRLPGLGVGHLFGRAMAQAAKGRPADARATLASLRALAEALPADVAAGQNSLKDVAGVAAAVVEARIAGAEHRAKDEIGWLRKAVAAEDALAYDEPRDWFVPSRHVLGAVLLRAGSPREAESVYRADLKQSPANGWALAGLRSALTAQGKRMEAAAVVAELKQAWGSADVQPGASAY